MIRDTIEHLGKDEAFFWVDEPDIHLLAKVGYQWVLQGTETEIPTPGTNKKQYLAAALNLRTGEIIYVVGRRKTNLLFRQLCDLLESSCGPRFKRIYVAADNNIIHKAKAVERWLQQHPCFAILWLPKYYFRIGYSGPCFNFIRDWVENEDQATSDACAQAERLRLEEVE